MALLLRGLLLLSLDWHAVVPSAIHGWTAHHPDLPGERLSRASGRRLEHRLLVV